jgi:hypothetical protein
VSRIIRRRDGRRLRRATVYFEPPLHKRIKLFCTEYDLKISDVVNAALSGNDVLRQAARRLGRRAR